MKKKDKDGQKPAEDKAAEPKPDPVVNEDAAEEEGSDSDDDGNGDDPEAAEPDSDDEMKEWEQIDYNVPDSSSLKENVATYRGCQLPFSGSGTRFCKFFIFPGCLAQA